MKKFLIAVAASSFALAGCGEKAADTSKTTDATGTDMAATNGMTTDGQARMNGGATGATGDSMSNAITGANDPQEYVNQAASSDQFQIQSSQMALQQSKNASVREFAQTMVDDHRASTRKLQTASTGASLMAPRTEMMAAHQAKLTELKNAGAKFDELYLEQQREAHKEAIDLHEAMTNSTAAPAQLSGFAREMLPKVQAHAKMLGAMKVNS